MSAGPQDPGSNVVTLPHSEASVEAVHDAHRRQCTECIGLSNWLHELADEILVLSDDSKALLELVRTKPRSAVNGTLVSAAAGLMECANLKAQSIADQTAGRPGHRCYL
jgi:hypothetical protein